MLQAWIFCPGVTLYAWLGGNLDPHLSALWGALAGGFLFVALYNFTQSLHGGAVSTNAPIFRLNFTITAALAILILHEPLTASKAVALACALVAVWLLLAEAGSERGEFELRVARPRAARDRHDGLDQFVLQNRPAAGRGARDHGGGAGLDVLLAGDAVRLFPRRAHLDPADAAGAMPQLAARRPVRRIRAADARRSRWGPPACWFRWRR